VTDIPNSTNPAAVTLLGNLWRDEMTTHLNRRKILAAVAAAPAAAVAPALAAAPAEGAGELAALVRQYFAELDAFEAWATETDPSDEESNRRAECTFNATRERMMGVPARSREDALAALDWLMKDCELGLHEYLDDQQWQHSSVVASMLAAIRGYLEGARP